MRRKLAPVFLLDEPHYHRLRPGAMNRFRGFALAVDGSDIDTISAGPITVACNLPSPDVATLVRIPRAANCRFDFAMRYDEPFDFVANDEVLWRYEPRPIDVPVDLPLPPGEVIAVTQGGTDVESYKNSILSGLTTMKAILPADPRDVLDIGCGTARMLVGWYADNPARHLAGVDINPDLIAWNQQHLPTVATWHVSAIEPPLPFADTSFDLVQLISVFTHLPLHLQRAWIDEIRRLLRPDGHAVVTLHGEIYAALMLDERLQHQLELDGHLSIAGAAEGANAFASFHMPWFAHELFRDFGVTFYERGPKNLFPIASLQDVYVLNRL